jgi:DNA mismatch endonuclease, patch repair protein
MSTAHSQRRAITRSENMRRIRSRDTSPERRLRRLLHKAGLRYRICSAKLPGKPDIVFTRWRIAVFVHGCFWHQHESCPRATLPNTRRDYWLPKLRHNKVRDARVVSELGAQGWCVLTLWECQINRNPNEAAQRVMALLRGSSSPQRRRKSVLQS